LPDGLPDGLSQVGKIQPFRFGFKIFLTKNISQSFDQKKIQQLGFMTTHTAKVIICKVIISQRNQPHNKTVYFIVIICNII